MKRSRRGCFVVGGIVMLLILLLGAGLWFFLFSNAETADAPPLPLVSIFLLSPASGDEVEVGDYVPVTLRAIGAEPLIDAELFVNGQSLGAVSYSPENASWVWQPILAGIYSLNARAIDINGEVGQAQMVIVTMLAGGDLYQQTVNVGGIFGNSIPFDQGTMHYQAVLQTDAGDTSTRTPHSAISPCLPAAL
jgi:hypothetical protein